MDEVGLLGVDAISLIAIILRCDFMTEAKERTVQHDSILTGQLYLQELLETRSTARFRDVTRMSHDTFDELLLLLETHGDFKDSKYLSTGEKLLIFILVLVGHSNRSINERWQHSGSTISLVVHQVATVMLSCQHLIIVPPTVLDPIPLKISGSRKFSPYFDNCIGALDGTHIHAVVPPEDRKPFRNRKHGISQNVLAVANFDMLFTYVLAGWEGSAHDSKVLDDAKLKGLPILPGKFYLGDAGYAFSWKVLTPYRGVRYHLKEWAQGNRRPQNAKELFNLRHSSLRNVIERIFGVVKKRFPILVEMSPYTFPFQCDLVLCAMMLHNFIRTNQIDDDEFDEPDVDNNNVVVDDDDDIEELEVLGNNNALKQWRDGIASAMWNDYEVFIQENGYVSENEDEG